MNPELVRRIEALLAQPVHFKQVLDAVADQPYRAVLLAWSDIRTRLDLGRDVMGRYFLQAGP